MTTQTSPYFLRRLIGRRAARLLACTTLVVGGAWTHSPIQAATLSWDGGTTTPVGTPGDGISEGADGLWTTAATTTNWDSGNGATDIAWTNGNTAVFGSTGVTGGVVTLGSAISAVAVNFLSSGYTIGAAGGTNGLTLTGTGTGTAAAIYTNGSGVTNTIAAPITVSATTQYWNVSAGDTLNLTGTVAFTGTPALLITSGITTGGYGAGTTGGTVNYSGTAFAVNKFTVDGGAVLNSSGTVNIPATGTYTGLGDNGNGTLNVTAGSFTTGAIFFLGSGATTAAPYGANNTGVLNLSGGTMTTSANVNVGTGYGNNSNALGVINIEGGLFSTGTGTGSVTLGNTQNGQGVLNLDGGVLASNSVFQPGNNGSNHTDGGIGPRVNEFNFNGGTLRATGTSLNITRNVVNASYPTTLTIANVRNGGAIIDTNNFAVTLSNILGHSTTGTLANAATITNGGSGYTSAPTVTVASTGGGIITSAIATVSGGVVTGVNITGTGFTAAPTVTFTGGGGTGATATEAFTADNAIDGGLTKINAGTLTLTGANTYTGPTIIGLAPTATVTGVGGTLSAAAATGKALGATNGIFINNGTLALTTANQAPATAPISMGTITGTSPSAGILTVAAGASQGVGATSTGGTVSGPITTGGTTTGTTTQGLGALTLNNTATLTYAGASTTLVFGTFTPNGNVLTITGYANNGAATAGNSGSGTDDRLVFQGNQSTNLADFNFGSGAGVGVGEVALDNGFYEVTFVAVPEPSTWVGGLLGLGMIGYTQRRRFGGWMKLVRQG